MGNAPGFIQRYLTKIKSFHTTNRRASMSCPRELVNVVARNAVVGTPSDSGGTFGSIALWSRPTTSKPWPEAWPTDTILIDRSTPDPILIDHPGRNQPMTNKTTITGKRAISYGRTHSHRSTSGGALSNGA